MNIVGAEYETRQYEVTRTRPTWVPEKPRFLNWIYAHLFAYFWLPCGRCGKYYGGHEWDGNGDGGSGTCWRHTDTVATVPRYYIVEGQGVEE